MLQRVSDVSDYIIALNDVVRDAAEDSKQRISAKVDEIVTCLSDVKEAVMSFGQRGFLQKFFRASKHAKTLMKLDEKIKRILESVQRDLQLEAIKMQLQDRSYRLDREVNERITERRSQEAGNLDEDEALDELESDPQALQAVCERAGISDEVVKSEFDQMGLKLEKINEMMVTQLLNQSIDAETEIKQAQYKANMARLKAEMAKQEVELAELEGNQAIKKQSNLNAITPKSSPSQKQKRFD